MDDRIEDPTHVIVGVIPEEERAPFRPGFLVRAGLEPRAPARTRRTARARGPRVYSPFRPTPSLREPRDSAKYSPPRLPHRQHRDRLARDAFLLPGPAPNTSGNQAEPPPRTPNPSPWNDPGSRAPGVAQSCQYANQEDTTAGPDSSPTLLRRCCAVRSRLATGGVAGSRPPRRHGPPPRLCRSWLGELHSPGAGCNPRWSGRSHQCVLGEDQAFVRSRNSRRR